MFFSRLVPSSRGPRQTGQFSAGARQGRPSASKARQRNFMRMGRMISIRWQLDKVSLLGGGQRAELQSYRVTRLQSYKSRVGKPALHALLRSCNLVTL